MPGSRRPSDLVSRTTTLIISNEEMNDIMRIFKYLEESGLLIKKQRVRVSELAKQLKMKQKDKKGVFVSVLLGTLGASLLGNLLTGKDRIRACEGTIREGQDF